MCDRHNEKHHAFSVVFYIVDSGPLLTLPEVAAVLRLSPVSVYRLVAARKIPFVKLAGGLRFLPGDIQRFVDNRRIDQNP